MNIDDHGVIHGDCRAVLASMPEGIADVCVTSPPYKDADGYSPDLLIAAFRELYRVVKGDAFLFLVFGGLAEDKSRPHRVVCLLEGLGWRLNESVVWEKNHYTPIQGDRRLNCTHENVFIFTRGDPVMDRMSIGVPHVDQRNIKRFGRPLRCRGTVWRIPYETAGPANKKRHPHEFPRQLAVDCLKLSGCGPGSTVIDPFAGGGTVMRAAHDLGMRSISIEKDAARCRGIKKLLRSDPVREINRS